MRACCFLCVYEYGSSFVIVVTGDAAIGCCAHSCSATQIPYVSFQACAQIAPLPYGQRFVHVLCASAEHQHPQNNWIKFVPLVRAHRVCICSHSIPSQSHSITGEWMGKAHNDVNVSVVFHRKTWLNFRQLLKPFADGWSYQTSFHSVQFRTYQLRIFPCMRILFCTFLKELPLNSFGFSPSTYHLWDMLLWIEQTIYRISHVCVLHQL